MLEGLFVFLIVFGVITLLGHGIWVAITHLFRLVFRSDDTPPTLPGAATHVNCPQCLAPLDIGQRRCPVCNWPERSHGEQDSRNALGALVKQLARFERLGMLDTEICRRVAGEIDAEREKLPPKPILPTLARADGVASKQEERAAEEPTSVELTPVEPVTPAATTGELAGVMATRTQDYAAHRAEAIAKAEAEIEARTPPPPKHQPFAKLFATFMEEKNIRWGELIGGLLIICGSIALVMSFWSQIAERPFLKFFLFNGVTAMLFGVGFYTHKRWDLRTTSRGTLIIATLLVPLNFLAITALTTAVPLGSAAAAMLLVGELASIAVFAALVYFAARVVLPDAARLVAVGVIVPSATQLLVRRWIDPSTSLAIIYALSATSALCYLIVTGLHLRHIWRIEPFGERKANCLFILFGVCSYAMVFPIGLLLFKTQAIGQTLHWLSPLIVLAGMPALTTGLIFWRRMAEPDMKLAGVRTTGLSVGVLGAMILAGATLYAWPDPATLLPVALVNAVIFTAIALLFEFPPAHTVAGASLTVAWLIGFHLATGRLSWDIDSPKTVLSTLLSARSGAVLIPLAAILGGGAFFWNRAKRREDANWYGIVATTITAISLGLAAWFGLFRGEWTTAAIAGYLFSLAVVWLLLAIVCGWERLFVAFEIALPTALLFSVAAVITNQTWYQNARWPWLDPWFLQAAGAALSVYCIAWTAARLGFARRGEPEVSASGTTTGRLTPAARQVVLLEPVGRFLNPPWWPVDRVIAVGIVCLLALLAVYAAMPGVAQELAPRPTLTQAAPPALQFALPDIPHYHAAGGGTWVMAAVIFGMLLVGMWERAATWRWIGLLVTAAAVCPLIAARFEPSIAAASALRWVLAAFFVVASVLIWFRGRVAVWAKQIGWNQVETGGNGQLLNLSVSGVARPTLLAILFCPLIAMAIYVSAAALGLAGIPQQILPALWWLGAAFVVVAVVSLVMRAGNRIEYKAEWQAGRRFVDVVLLIAAGAVFVILFFAIAAALQKHPIVGPKPGRWFHEIGMAVSYVVPVLVIAATLIGHAIRERDERYAFSAGLLFNLGATIAYAFTISATTGMADGIAWVRIAQINAIVAAAFGLAWMAAVWWAGRAGRAKPQAGTSPLLITQVSLAAALCVLSILPAALWIVVDPSPAAWVGEAGHVLGWIGLALTAAALAWIGRRVESGSPIHLIGAGITVLGPMIAVSAQRWDTGANWLGYHALLTVTVAAAWLMPAVERFIAPLKSKTATNAWSTAFGIAAVVLAFLAIEGDPAYPWWLVGTFVAMIGLSAVLAARTGWQIYVYAAGLLFNIAVGMWWDESGRRLTGSRDIEFLFVNILALAAPVVGWVALHRKYISPANGVKTGWRLIGFHRVAGSASVFWMLLIAVISLMAHRTGWAGSIENRIILWSAFAATAVAVVACLWDPRTRFTVAHLYLLGLAGVGLLLDGLGLQDELFDWSLTLILAAYSLGTSYLWSRRGGLWELAARFGAPPREHASPTSSHPGFGWMVPANLLLAVLVTLSSFSIVLSFGVFQERMIVAYAIIAQAFAIGMLARGVVRSPLQYTALSFGSLGAIAFGLAWLSPDITAPLLHRMVVVVVALAAVIVLYGFGLVKLLRRENEWTKAAVRLVPILAGLAGVALLVVLGIEVAYFIQTGESAAFWPAILAVAIAVGGLAVAALAAAVLPGRDPFGLSERGKQAYVYAAEVLLGLLFVHIRVSMPWLFSGWFMQFWPIIVMAIAFAGVGLSEWFRNHRQRVLSEPLERTGALLPMLPVIGFWVVPANMHYSIVLLAVGLLYSVLATLRKSFVFAILAALAGNGGLWYLLHRADGLGLMEHPQLWLIPPALCALVASYMNRRQLSDEQMTTIRYLSSIVIYVSSTADVFLIGMAEAPWLPLVLAAASIAGVFAGIALRVRAFLYLGTAFLLVALFTYIWHAAVDLEMTWIWWVATICAGVAIITVFAVFEKKRDDILRIVDELKKWKA